MDNATAVSRKMTGGWKSAILRAYTLLLVICFAWPVAAGDVDQLRTSATAGDASSQYELGMRLLITEARFPGNTEAVDWIRRAAEQGYRQAQGRLGLFYRTGENLPRDYNAALIWYRLAADKGSGRAQLELAQMHFNGEGVTANIEDGFSWLRLAVEQNNPAAQALLGRIYARGDYGVEKDWTQATRWSRLSAEQGSPDGQFQYGLALSLGNGVVANREKGFALIEMAANQGFPAAISVLTYRRQLVEKQETSRMLADRYRRYFEANRPQSGAFNPSSAAPYRVEIPQNSALSSNSTNPLDCPYGDCRSNSPSQAASGSPIGNLATLQGQESAGGGYYTCHYITSAGYRFTTTSRSTCSGSVQVDPESGRAW